MRVFAYVGALLCALFLSSTSTWAQGGGGHAGFYIGVVYIKFDGAISIPEYSAGAVGITVDANGNLTGDFSGTVNAAGAVTFNPNSFGFTTGTITAGTIAATVSNASGAVTTTYRIDAKQTAPGYGASGTLAGRLSQLHPAQNVQGMNAVTYTGTKFVAVGQNGSIAMSDDGLNWTRHGAGTTIHLTSVAFKPGARGGNSTMVVAGNDGIRLYSIDGGETWTARSVNGGTFVSLAAGAGRFLSANSIRGMETSTDGNVWTALTTPPNTGSYTKFYFLNNQFVAAGGNSISFSADGLTWSPAVNPGVSGTVTGSRTMRVAYGNGRWVVGGTDSIAYSDNGTTWTKATGPTGSFIDAAAFGNGAFTVHTGADDIWSSTNGAVWTRILRSGDMDIVFGEGRFVGVGGKLWTSTDGYSWVEARLNSMNHRQPYVGRSQQLRDGPSGLAPVLGSGAGANIGSWWFGENGYLYYYLNPFANLYGPTNITQSTLRTFVEGDFGVSYIGGDDGTIIRINQVGGNNPPGLRILNSPTAESFLDSIMIDRTIIFVGTGGTIARTSDLTGTNFVTVNTGTTETLRQVVYFRTQDGAPINLAIATGDNGTVLTSPNGSAWTRVSVPTTENIVGANFMATKPAHLMVATESGAVFASTNGVNWFAAPSMPTTQKLVAFGQGELGLMASPLIVTNLSDLRWSMTYDINQPSPGFQSLARGNGLWVGIGADFSAASRDGQHWQMTPTLGGLREVAFGEGKFVAVGGAATGISYDGLKWQLLTNFPITGASAITYGGGKFVAVGGGKVMLSDDGTQWVDKTPTGASPYNTVIYADGKFIAGGHAGDGAVSEDNGETWRTTFTFVGATSAVAGGDGRYVFAGVNGQVASSTDTRTWTRKQMTYRGPIESYPDFAHAAYAGGVFHLFGTKGEVYVSTNGVDFTQLHSGLAFNAQASAIAVANGKIMLAVDGEVHALAVASAGIPSISTQPASTQVAGGATATFSVAATGTSLRYQWFYKGLPLANGNGISGATTATLSVASVDANDAGNYYVVVENDSGSVASADATLTVQAPPFIVQQPQPVTVVQPGSAVLSVRVEGPGPITYQWRKDGVNLSVGGPYGNVNTASLVMNQLAPTNSGSYDVVITNPFGSVTSAIAHVTVDGLPTPPIITVPPTSMSVREGGTITLRVQATGARPMQYSWLRFPASLPVTGTRVSGQGTDTLTITNAELGDTGSYVVMAINSLGVAQSQPFNVTVLGEFSFREDFTIDTQGAVNDIVQITPNEFVIGGSMRMSSGAYSTEGLAKIDGGGKLIAGFPAQNPGGGVFVQTLALQADGKLIVGGQFPNGWAGNASYKHLVRLNVDGTIDTTFNPPALASNLGQWVAKVVVLPDGKILVGRYGTVSAPSTIIRYNADGTVDSGFTQVTAELQTILVAMGVQRNGSIWYSGTMGLRKVPANGGNHTQMANGNVRFIYVAPDDRVYFINSGNFQRFRADGSIDHGFFHQIGASIVTALPDGRLLVGGGITTVGGHPTQRLALLSAEGVVDKSYTSPYINGSGVINVMLPLADGSAFIGGSIVAYEPQKNLQRIQVTPRPNTGGGDLAEWLAGKGLTAGVNDGPQQDPDSDGLSNLAEYALGTNPLQAGANEKPKALTLQSGGQGFAGIEFTRNKTAAGAEIEITASNSLTANSNETVTETVQDLGNGLERVTVRSTRSLSEVSRLFFTVKVRTN